MRSCITSETWRPWLSKLLYYTRIVRFCSACGPPVCVECLKSRGMQRESSCFEFIRKSLRRGEGGNLFSGEEKGSEKQVRRRKTKAVNEACGNFKHLVN